MQRKQVLCAPPKHIGRADFSRATEEGEVISTYRMEVRQFWNSSPQTSYVTLEVTLCLELQIP